MAYPRSPRFRRSRSPVRVRAQLGDLGILPAVAAAVPSVSQILGKIGASVLAVVDPGKKRDAVREGQAEAWYQWAIAGSITAARTLHGGTHFPYTVKEKGYYTSRWASFQAAQPALAQQALALGDLSPVDAGNSITPVQIPAATQAQVQSEITAYHLAHATAGTTPPSQPGLTIASAGIGGIGSPLVLGAAFVYALVTGVFKKRR